jgi:hypothetical protein
MADETNTKRAKKAKSENRMISPGQSSTASPKAPPPEWAKGLKRLYNSVVEEPLPDSFADLIAKLDSRDS